MKRKIKLKSYIYFPLEVIEDIVDGGNILTVSFSGDLKDSFGNNGRLVLKEWWPDYKSSQAATCLYIYNPINKMIGLANEPDCFIYQYINSKYKEYLRVNTYNEELENNINYIEDKQFNL